MSCMRQTTRNRWPNRGIKHGVRGCLSGPQSVVLALGKCEFGTRDPVDLRSGGF